MLSAGLPLKVVSEIFGQASVAITRDVYGHVSPDVSHQALTWLSDAPACLKRWSKKVVNSEDDHGT
jgi:integrase